MSFAVLQGAVVINRALLAVNRAEDNGGLYTTGKIKDDFEYIPREGELMFDPVDENDVSFSSLAGLNVDGHSIAVFNGEVPTMENTNEEPRLQYNKWRFAGTARVQPGANIVQGIVTSRTVLPVVRQGTVSIVNNGPDTFGMHDKIMWYLPSKDEFTASGSARAVARIRPFNYKKIKEDIIKSSEYNAQTTNETKATYLSNAMREAESRVIGEAQSKALPGALFPILLQ